MNYFNKKHFFHGIMFHHFHDKKIFKKGQGSISQKDFYKILKHIGLENIISANDTFKLYNKKNSKKKVCITFDDGLKCQYMIARPILNYLGIKAFFFVFSNIFESKPDLIEVNRVFRLQNFKSINQFYMEFFNLFKRIYKIKNIKDIFKNEKNFILHQKKKFPFYSIGDIKFRLIRDKILKKTEYDKIMLKMFKMKNFDYKEILKKNYFSEDDLKRLSDEGHVIGLHSHSHPTSFKKLKYVEQKKEFITNKKILEKIVKRKIKSMSHPCGSFNNSTLKILNNMNIKIGFNQNIIEKVNFNNKYQNLYIPREDHSNIIKNIKK